ncbi:MAG: NADH:ubiquinone oxidoreductase subunit 1 (chain H) [Acidimicrobiaceae bacterium]|nr:NADH:ubiquinone oxidoreductase subunit 1 (chain H) [Acidimicrobiaceae bacterium]
MRTYMAPGVAVVSVAVAMAIGVYAVAVIDGIAGRLVAGAGRRGVGVVLDPPRTVVLLLMQRRHRTERADAQGWALAPALLGGLAATGLAVVPVDRGTAVADPGTGFVVFATAIAFVMIAVFLHGWSPNSLFPLIGAYRYGAQALSLQIPFLLAMLATALPAESLAVMDIVEAQGDVWNVVRQPLGLPIYLMVGVGVGFWGPLNLPDGADLVGGTSAEDAGTDRLAWEVARAAMLFAIAAMGAAVFLGGWWGPLLPGPVWMALKTLCLLVVMVASRHLLARVRIEPFVVACWAVFIPLALVNIFVSGALLL